MAIYPFTPTTLSSFQFQPAFDGATYNIIVNWSLDRRDYMVNCFALDGTLVFSLPLIGSPPLLILQGLSWANGRATATVATTHGYRPGQTFNATIYGSAPLAYNGNYDCLALDDFNFSYVLAANPGATIGIGSVGNDISIAAGYFDSTLVYRPSSGQFEVSP